MRPLREAECHPDRLHYAKGLCSRCYGRTKLRPSTKKPPKAPSCHPDRAHHAKGMCRQCYFKGRSKGAIRAVVDLSVVPWSIRGKIMGTRTLMHLDCGHDQFKRSYIQPMRVHCDTCMGVDRIESKTPSCKIPQKIEGKRLKVGGGRVMTPFLGTCLNGIPSFT